MTIYQLVANGHSAVTGQLRNVTDKIAYRTEEQALANKDKFIKRLTTPKDERDLGYLDKKNLRVHVQYITLAD